MKKLYLIALVAIFSISAYAQNKKANFKPNDMIGNKAITHYAKEFDEKAFNDTKELYKQGMSENDFITKVLSIFPTQLDRGLKEITSNYFKYIFTLHNTGVKGSASSFKTSNGSAFAQLLTDLNNYNIDNPNVIDKKSLGWRGWLTVIGDAIKIVISN